MTPRKLALAAALAAAACTPAHPAFAESASAACASYAEMTETLRRRFGETLRLSAEEQRGFALEFFANGDGSWTLVVRRDGPRRPGLRDRLRHGVARRAARRVLSGART
jgi:hypothetical protein